MAGVCVLGGLIMAALLQPDPRGFGTHQQFGFPPCSFRMLLGIPCPSCGGTTSFAHFVRGQWTQSLQANVAGFALALVSAGFVPWSAWSCWQGRTVGISSPSMTALAVMLSLSGLAAAQWIFRLCL